MIGKVEWTEHLDAERSMRVTMVLGDDQVFRSDQMPNLARALTENCRAQYAGPSDGIYGLRFLRELAAEKNGTMTTAEFPEAQPGLVCY